MENVQIFKYNENPISFQMGEHKMINATQMAKSFGKRPIDWLRFQQSKDFLDALTKVRNHTLDDLVIVTKGGVNSGTWMQEDVAIEFARWLSPMFAIWCNDRMKELFRFGLTATDEMLIKATTDPEFVMVMMDQLKQNRRDNLELKEENSLLRMQIDENAHKVNFFDNVTKIDEDYNKRKTILISKLARRFKMSAPALNKFLITKGVITRVDGGYDIHPNRANGDIAYQIVKEETEYDDCGDVKYPGRKYMEYTPKGVELITNLLSEAGLIKR